MNGKATYGTAVQQAHTALQLFQFLMPEAVPAIVHGFQLLSSEVKLGEHAVRIGQFRSQIVATITHATEGTTTLVQSEGLDHVPKLAIAFGDGSGCVVSQLAVHVLTPERSQIRVDRESIVVCLAGGNILGLKKQNGRVVGFCDDTCVFGNLYVPAMCARFRTDEGSLTVNAPSNAFAVSGNEIKLSLAGSTARSILSAARSIMQIGTVKSSGPALTAVVDACGSAAELMLRHAGSSWQRPSRFTFDVMSGLTFHTDQPVEAGIWQPARPIQV